MLSLEAVSLICSLLQIVGIVLIALRKQLPSNIGALISVTGFAAVIRALLPTEGGPDALTLVAGVAGIVIIIWGVILTKNADVTASLKKAARLSYRSGGFSFILNPTKLSNHLQLGARV